MVFNIIFYLCFIFSLQQEIQNMIKISVDKSSVSSFYIYASFDKMNTIILPLKIELNSLTTSIVCNDISPINTVDTIKRHTSNLLTISEDEIISCSDNLCYKLFIDEDKCDESLENKCPFTSMYKYDINRNISGIYIQHYFNLFLNNSYSIERNNILPIGCIEDNYNTFNENINAGILSLGGEQYSFLQHYYKENNFKKKNSFFSICLDPEEGGYLTFGYLTDEYHINNDLPINFIYDIKDSYYIFKINNIFFNHENINKEEYKAIFNMNNEYTFVNKKIINNLYILFKNYLTKKLLKKYQLDLYINNNDLYLYGICFINKNEKDIQFKEKLLTIFPALFIRIQNGYYKWNSEYYLYKKQKDEYCIGLLSNEKKEDLIELGLNFMYGHELIFNFSKKEIIIYESNCSMKPKKKINVELESKYNKINGYLRILIIFLIIIVIYLFFVILRLKKRRSFLCVKLLGKKVTNEDINKFFNTNYNIIQ